MTIYRLSILCVVAPTPLYNVIGTTFVALKAESYFTITSQLKILWIHASTMQPSYMFAVT